MKSIYFEADIPKVVAMKVLTKISRKFYYSSLSPVIYNKNLPDEPLPGDNWVKVRNILAGVCGTDLSFFLVKPSPKIALSPLPGSKRTFLGHELVGIVESVGDRVEKFRPGDRVTMQKYMPCCDLKDLEDKCRFCKEGLYCLCENYGVESPKKLNNLGAGFGDYFLAPENQLIKIPDDVSDDEGVMIEAAAVSLHSVLRHIPKAGEKVLVFGGGTIGLNVIQCLKIINPECEVYLLEKVKSKQEFALKLGADYILNGDPYKAVTDATGGKLYEGMFNNRMIMGGFDVIYDCVGTAFAFHNCLRWLRARGTYVKIGHHLNPTAYDETPIWWQEINIVGVNAHGMEDYQGKKISTFDLVIELIQQGKLNLDGFITHRFILDDYKKAFYTMANKPEEVIKVVLHMED